MSTKVSFPTDDADKQALTERAVQAEFHRIMDSVGDPGSLSREASARRDVISRHGMTLRAVGSWRVYFNRHGAAPRVWCVAPEAGGWEIAVSGVTIEPGASTAHAIYRPKATADEDDGKPSAWIAVEGLLTVDAAGHATIGEP